MEGGGEDARLIPRSNELSLLHSVACDLQLLQVEVSSFTLYATTKASGTNSLPLKIDIHLKGNTEFREHFVAISF